MKLLLNRLSVFVLFILFVAASCKKEGSSASGKYYVKFKADGVQHEFRSDMGRRMGGGTSGPVNYYGINTYLFGMEGYGDVREAFPSIQISVQSPAAISVNTIYSTNTNGNARDGLSEIYYNAKDASSPQPIHYIKSSNVQITITEMGDKTIRANFSGTVTNSDGTKQSIITQGEFYGERTN